MEGPCEKVQLVGECIAALVSLALGLLMEVKVSGVGRGRWREGRWRRRGHLVSGRAGTVGKPGEIV